MKSKSLEPMKFDDIGLIEIDVEVKGKPYKLVEASEGAASVYQNATLASFTLGPNGKAQKISGLADVESLLVSLCLKEIRDGKEFPVPQNVIKTWPTRVVKQLFERAKEISNLGESELQGQVHRAFSLPESPVPLEGMRQWLDTLDGEYDQLKGLFAATPEESAKN